MDQLGQFKGQNLLGGVQLAALPLVHLVDLLQGQEGQHPQALEHVVIPHVAPVLVELIGAGLVGIQPDGALGGLAHLLALGVEQQGDGHGVGVLAQLAADELGAAQHIGPLIVAAELHIAAVVLEQVVEVVGLHDHVVELQEGETLLHALLIALGPEHIVHREAGAHIPQHLNVVQLQQPVGVVHHLGLALAELDEAFHLLLEAVAVVLDGLRGHHAAHIGAAGGVADIASAAADQGDGAVARHLEPLHQAQGHEVAHMEGVGGGVKADVEHGLPLVDHFGDLLLIGHLGNEAAGFQLFVTSHRSYSFLFYSEKLDETLDSVLCRARMTL